MNFRLSGLLLILLGFIILLIMGLDGFLQVGLLLFIPFIISTSPFAVIPFIMIFAGFVLTFMSVPKIRRPYLPDDNSEAPEEKNSRIGGFIMIGPIPIIFGNDKKLIYISLAVAVGIIVLYLLFALNLL